ncbi:hypothetical protein AFR_13390 [Actinoplanes friuliensis DSM 7358]|uniref:Uncharacterized protein n=2 Tax=Actinoplanes friuliensis TaxID=196914 RepID=U5VVR2_9ACTN|nr:hypothetical protein AFR_13390 [Actinoplanes friuliensis DSM 7358]
MKTPRSGHTPATTHRWRHVMRALIYTVAAVAIVLIVLGLILKAVKWLIIIGLIALVASIVMGVVKGRRALR